MLEGQQIAQQIGFAPMPAVAAILSRYERAQIAGFIEIAIGLLDVMDGDADLEADDRGGETLAVPEGLDEPEKDDRVDPDLEETDTEDAFWLSPMAYRVDRSGAGCAISDPGGAAEREDDEDDDPSGQMDEDECNTGPGTFGWDDTAGPGCPISDPGGHQYD
jgi:hypothetical protein